MSSRARAGEAAQAVCQAFSIDRIRRRRCGAKTGKITHIQATRTLSITTQRMGA